jgi:hypothetical protein
MTNGRSFHIRMDFVSRSASVSELVTGSDAGSWMTDRCGILYCQWKTSEKAMVRCWSISYKCVMMKTSKTVK